MDATRFDLLIRSLARTGSRRGLLGLLPAFPIIGGLGSLLDEEDSAAKGRHKRRHKAHHGRSLMAEKKRKKKKHKKKKCKPQSVATTCAGKCGNVTNNCKQAVDCGSCACDASSCSNLTPICVDGSCAACSGAHPCPSGQVCCGVACFAGNCCDTATCGGATPFCTNHSCAACTSNGQCQTAGLGDLCCSGQCVIGVCCADGDCAPAGNDCVNQQCHCGNGAGCSGSTPDCCGSPGACTNTDTDKNNCGTCGHVCSGATPVCWAGECVCGDVCANGCPFNSVQAAINGLPAGSTIRICAGTYGAITISKNLTLIGAGQGSNPASNTILNAQGSGRVIHVTSGITATLQGMRITGGADNGGGIRNDGDLTVLACTVAGNTAPFFMSSGGGVRNGPGATLAMTDCTISDNHADNPGGSLGGGIANIGGTLSLSSGTSVTDNWATSGGGGIANIGGTLTLNSGASVTQNSSGSAGGGIFNIDGTVTLNAGSLVCDNDEPQCHGFTPPGGFCGSCP